MTIARVQMAFQPGEIQLAVDGVDQPSERIRRVSFDVPRGEIPRLYVEVEVAGDLVGDAIVHEVAPSVVDEESEVITRWLGNLDPRALEEDRKSVV